MNKFKKIKINLSHIATYLKFYEVLLFLATYHCQKYLSYNIMFLIDFERAKILLHWANLHVIGTKVSKFQG